MHSVVTLVAADRLSRDLVAAAVTELERLSVRVGEPDWLAAGKACDLPVETESEIAAGLDEVLDGRSVDVAIQKRSGRRKRLLVTDMESTIIRNEMLDELADFANVRPKVEEITALAMNGELDFEGAVRDRVQLLAGLPVVKLDEAAKRIEIVPGAHELVATMGSHGATTALVSGGFGCFAESVRDALGFDQQQSNELLIADGHLTGELREPILGSDAKLEALRELCRELGIEAHDAVAVGDGANDLPMLRAAGLGVAFHGKPTVARSAPFRIDHGDLTTLLYFQGYRGAEISTGLARAATDEPPITS